jgi:hypothetical protein
MYQLQIAIGWRSRPVEVNFLDASRTQVVAAFIIVLILSCYPLFTNKFLSINDLLNHLARAWILLHLKDTPAFRQEYAPNWRMLPNLALDIYANILGRVLPLPLVGKSFVALTFALIMSGSTAVHQAIYRKWSIWPLATAIFLYNKVLMAGEVNFLFAVGLYLHVTALWIRLRGRSWPWRAGLVSVGAIVIFFAHLFAVGLLAITLGGYEIGHGLQQRRPLLEIGRNLLVVALPFLVPVFIALFWTPHSATSFVVVYRGIGIRLIAFATPLLYHPLIEAGGFAVLPGVLAWLASRGAVRLDPGMAIALLLLFLVQLAMPNQLFTGKGADYRIPIPWDILAISAVDIIAETRRVAQLVIAAVVALLIGRLTILDLRWSSDNRLYASIAQALQKLPHGVTAALGFPPWAFSAITRPGIAAFYLPTWEIARHGGFTQMVYTIPTQDPLIMRPQYARLAAATSPYLVWQEFDRPSACPSASAQAKPPPRAWARFNAFVILFPDLRCLHPIRPLTLLYQSPAMAIYENPPGSARRRGRTVPAVATAR